MEERERKRVLMAVVCEKGTVVVDEGRTRSPPTPSHLPPSSVVVIPSFDVPVWRTTLLPARCTCRHNAPRRIRDSHQERSLWMRTDQLAILLLDDNESLNDEIFRKRKNIPRLHLRIKRYGCSSPASLRPYDHPPPPFYNVWNCPWSVHYPGDHVL